MSWKNCSNALCRCDMISWFSADLPDLMSSHFYCICSKTTPRFAGAAYCPLIPSQPLDRLAWASLCWLRWLRWGLFTEHVRILFASPWLVQTDFGRSSHVCFTEEVVVFRATSWHSVAHFFDVFFDEVSMISIASITEMLFQESAQQVADHLQQHRGLSAVPWLRHSARHMRQFSKHPSKSTIILGCSCHFSCWMLLLCFDVYSLSPFVDSGCLRYEKGRG